MNCIIGQLVLLLLARWQGEQANPYVAESVSISSRFIIGVVFLIHVTSLIFLIHVTSLIHILKENIAISRNAIYTALTIVSKLLVNLFTFKMTLVIIYLLL